MKPASCIFLAGLWSSTQAFPHLSPLSSHAARQLDPLSSESQLKARQVSLEETNCGPVPCLVFDPVDQFVDVSPTSKNPYIPPGPGDLRGPCPGLNAAANHGFIPRSGILGITETITGLVQAYGMGVNLATFLATIAVVTDGDVTTQTWSIGGPFQGSTLDILSPEPQGISYSHNKYEGDASACRADAYINDGDAHSLIMSKFEHLYNIGDSYTIDNVRSQNVYNVELSKSTNPYYFSAPFSGLLVAPAAHHFIINFMSNHSADNPGGYLDRAQLKTFFGVSGPDDALVWNPGQEQIPQNWYRRPSSNPYDSPAAVADLVIEQLMYPDIFVVGGNTGAVNTFAGVDLGDLTGGVYNATNLLEGNYLFCFAIQALALPDTLRSLLADVGAALALLNPIIESLGCPELEEYNVGLFSPFPGATYAPSGGDTSY